MRQVRFPKIVLPISAVLAETFRFGFGLAVVIFVGLGLGVTPDYRLAFLPLVIAVQFVFTLGIAFLLSGLNILFRDVQHLADYLLRAWFFLSPGLYLLSAVPERYRDLYDLNPFATIMPAYHDILLYHAAPDFVRLGVVAAAAIPVVLVAYGTFVRLEPSFAKVH
jgi:ABC-type polysaccharide/polyol phosphate export permease